MMLANEQASQPLVRLAVETRPVSVNRALAFGRGHAYKPEPAKEYELAVYAAALEWRVEQGYWHLTTLAGMLQGSRVRLTFWGVRGDADNYVKIALDGLARGLGVNDRCFTSVESVRVRTRPGLHAGVRIEVWPATTAAAEAVDAP